jgi:hypothetical protein
MQMLAKHPLVELLQNIKSKQQLLDVCKNHVNDWSKPQTSALLPKPKVIDFKAMGLNLDIDFVGFQHSFYQEAFREITLADSTKKMLALRVCAFVDLKYDENNKVNIPLM